MTLLVRHFDPGSKEELKPKQEIEMSVFLKIKLKSLAAEARIIRKQELKTRGPSHNATRESLYRHRIDVVRRCSRETHLAYGYTRGRAYVQLERTCYSPPDWKAVAAMVKKYGKFDEKEFERWKSSEENSSSG